MARRTARSRSPFRVLDPAEPPQAHLHRCSSARACPDNGETSRHTRSDSSRTELRLGCNYVQTTQFHGHALVVFLSVRFQMTQGRLRRPNLLFQQELRAPSRCARAVPRPATGAGRPRGRAARLALATPRAVSCAGSLIVYSVCGPRLTLTLKSSEEIASGYVLVGVMAEVGARP